MNISWEFLISVLICYPVRLRTCLKPEFVIFIHYKIYYLIRTYLPINNDNYNLSNKNQVTNYTISLQFYDHPFQRFTKGKYIFNFY